MEVTASSRFLAMAVVGAIALAITAVAAFFVAERVFETGDGVCVTIGTRTISLPDGSIGDLNTLRGECGMLGLACLLAASLLVLVPFVREPLLRSYTIGCLGLSLAVAALFAFVVMR